MKAASRRRSFLGAATVIKVLPPLGHRFSPIRSVVVLHDRCSSVPHRWLMTFDFLRPILAVQLRRDLLRLFAVATNDRELMLALLAVPDRVLAATAHGDAHFTDVLRNLVPCHTFAKSA